MKFDLTEIAHSLGMTYTYEVDGEASDDLTSGLAAAGVTLHAPVRGRLTFTNTGQLLLARGSISTSMELECVRCLTRFPADVRMQIEEQFPLHPGAAIGEPDADFDPEEVMLEGDLDMADDLFQDNRLDLTELIRQNLLVNAPLAALCDQTCRGLCPHCGQNLNQGSCACPPDEDDSARPLKAALKDWM